MTRFSVLLCLALAAAGCSAPEGPANRLEKANVLPLALDDSYQFRKVQQSIWDNTKIVPATTSEAANFERQRAYWGAIDGNKPSGTATITTYSGGRRTLPMSPFGLNTGRQGCPITFWPRSGIIRGCTDPENPPSKSTGTSIWKTGA